MKTKQNNSMRASALQTTFTSLLAVLLTLGTAPARDDPANGTWTVTGNMGTARGDHTATLLRSGKVLVAGGFNDADGTLSSAELYDARTATWTATGNMGSARY